MRVVGYVRESSDPSADRPAFSQQEELRRYCAKHGHALVSICQDVRSPGRGTGRDGYLGLLGVVATGAVDGVLVPGLDTFSSDTILQEIALWDLRARGVRVISTKVEDLEHVGPESSADPSRTLIRDVLQRVEEHQEQIPAAAIDLAGAAQHADVYVQLIEAER